MLFEHIIPDVEVNAIELCLLSVMTKHVAKTDFSLGVLTFMNPFSECFAVFQTLLQN